MMKFNVLSKWLAVVWLQVHGRDFFSSSPAKKQISTTFKTWGGDALFLFLMHSHPFAHMIIGQSDIGSTLQHHYPFSNCRSWQECTPLISSVLHDTSQMYLFFQALLLWFCPLNFPTVLYALLPWLCYIYYIFDFIHATSIIHSHAYAFHTCWSLYVTLVLGNCRELLLLLLFPQPQLQSLHRFCY